MMKKITEAYKKMNFRTKSGILIIFTGVVVAALIIIEAITSPTRESQAPNEIPFAISEDELTHMELLEEMFPETRRVEHRGLYFTIPENWQAEDTEDLLTISIPHEEQEHLLLVETIDSSINLPLENNLALATSLFDDTVSDLEFEAMFISGLPSLRLYYTIVVEEVHYNITGFLFPNGDELIYVQFGTPTKGSTDETLIQFITNMIIRLELPPSEFPPLEIGNHLKLVSMNSAVII